jgi:hypothetical protein
MEPSAVGRSDVGVWLHRWVRYIADGPWSHWWVERLRVKRVCVRDVRWQLLLRAGTRLGDEHDGERDDRKRQEEEDDVDHGLRVVLQPGVGRRGIVARGERDMGVRGDLIGYTSRARRGSNIRRRHNCGSEEGL